MRRVGSVLAAAAVTAGLLATSPAGASSAPALSAPASVTYYSTVSLTGTTPSPHEAVEILFRAAGTPNYVARRHLTSDAAGHFATTYTALSTQYIAARAAGVNSYVRVVHVPTAHCTVSKPAFTSLSLTPGLTASSGAWAQFTATRGYTWAGTAWDVDPQLITWHGAKPHVLASYKYRDTVISQQRSVRAVGFTPHYALVANVQDPSIKVGVTSTRPLPLRAYYWWHGVRHTMSHGHWVAWEATGMSDSGAVIGYALTSSASYVIEWPHAGSPYRVIARGTDPLIDARGDIAWQSATRHFTMRTVEGRTHLLQAYDPTRRGWTSAGIESGGASANAFYATDVGDRTVRWYVHPESPDGGVMHAVVTTGPSAVDIDAVGRQNSVVVGYLRGYLRTASGAYTAMPSQYFDATPGINAVNMHGTVAFTAKSDRRVHFLRCSTS